MSTNGFRRMGAHRRATFSNLFIAVESCFSRSRKGNRKQSVTSFDVKRSTAFPRVAALEEARLSVLVELVVESFAETESEHFEVGVCFADGDAIGIASGHSVECHGALSCTLGGMGRGREV